MSKKPREFWIAGKSDGSFSAHEFPCVDMSGYYRALHVREVVPIDWLKINKEVYEKDPGLDASTLFLIQDLIEKQLAGEE